MRFKNWLPKYKRLILMFQKEVADKILAKYNAPNYGRLSIIAAAKLKIIDRFNVSPNCFFPIPKVESTVLILEPITNKNFKVKNIENLEKITHVFFSKKRKMINKAFNELFKNPSNVADKLNINLNLRPNKLTENEFFKIAEYFEKQL